MSGFWKPGDEIVFRHVHDGEIRYAAPYRVLEDCAHRTVLYLPHFSVVYSISEGRLRPQQWHASVLRIIEPEKWYSLLFFWSSDDERQPMHWYVNLELPANRTPLGFDSRDLSLDVLISPDGSRATLKDVEEFEAAAASAALPIEHVIAARTAAEEAIADARAGAGVFAEGWPDWRPERELVAVLPDEWWHIEGIPPSATEPRTDDYTEEELNDWAVEAVRQVRLQAARPSFASRAFRARPAMSTRYLPRSTLDEG